MLSMVEIHKSGQGLSMNTIIIAALVMIVLVVLWAIFTGSMNLFAKDKVECRGVGSYKECPEGFADKAGTNYPHCCIETLGGSKVEIVPLQRLP